MEAHLRDTAIAIDITVFNCLTDQLPRCCFHDTHCLAHPYGNTAGNSHMHFEENGGTQALPQLGGDEHLLSLGDAGLERCAQPVADGWLVTIMRRAVNVPVVGKCFSTRKCAFAARRLPSRSHISCRMCPHL